MKTIIEKAYKKLKAAVYYDKTLLHLRDKIVKFEEKNLNISDNKNIDDKLKTIYEMLTGDEDNWSKYQKEILDSIGILAYPKKLKTANNKETDKNFILVCDLYTKNVDIDTFQYFLDIDIKGQILGVLWILLIGKTLDSKDESYEHSYGNRLRKNLINENGKISYYPVLFEPYFSQYERWRDKGLEIAKDNVNSGHDVIMLTMDFKSFFYSVNYNNKDFDNILKKLNWDELDEFDKVIYKRVNDFVYKVIKKYSEKFSIINNDEDKSNVNNNKSINNLLPIGFLPSNILANWRLNGFDKQILDRWNPLYYGRYVDDILIVDKIDKNSQLYENIKNGNYKISEILKYYFNLCNADKCKKCTNGRELLKIDYHDKEEYYYINEVYVANNESKIIVQKNKVKVFYFPGNVSNDIINHIRKEIEKNTSEFRCFPRSKDGDEPINETEVFQVNRNETINKISGITDIKIDKFNLSKTIGKATFIAAILNDKYTHSIAVNLVKNLDAKALIEKYSLWEKQFELLILQDEYNEYSRLCLKIIGAIDRIGDINKKISNIDLCKFSLMNYLHACICKSLALSWNENIKKILDDICDRVKNTKYADIFDNINDYRKLYCRSRMINKYMIPVCIDFMFDDKKWMNDSYNIRLFNINDQFKYIKYKMIEDDKKIYKYHPTTIKLQEILYSMNCASLVESSFVLDIIKIRKAKELYKIFNYAVNECSVEFEKILILDKNEKANPKYNKVYIKNTAKDEIKVAVANTKVKDENFIAALMKNGNRDMQRYKSLAKILYETKAENVDLLVLPENYLPYEWLPRLMNFCANNQIAIITGIEHFVVDNKKNKNGTVHNLTAVILPYKIDEYQYAYLNLHEKVYYSPEEKRQITGYRYQFNEGNIFELYYWKGMYFPVFCCFELASIKNRALFQSIADLFIAIEWNRDTNYFSNIIESLCRDIHCYCVQVNSSNYGDSRIVQPTKSDRLNIVRTKGGVNNTILVGKINIKKLREYQIQEYELQKDNIEFKTTPPGFDKDIVWNKMHNLSI